MKNSESTTVEKSLRRDNETQEQAEIRRAEEETLREKMEEENLVFGWVDPQVQFNFAAWAVAKSTGNKKAADRYFQETRSDYEGSHDWFEVEAE